jgi:pyridoxine kinase
MNPEHKQRVILAANDLSCVGTASLMVAIPVLTYFGHEVVPFPTVCLSSTTDIDSDPAALDTNNWLKSCVKKWSGANKKFDAIYTGWLGDYSQIDMLTSICESMLVENGLVFVDPVLGDCGDLYPCQAQIAEKMPDLVRNAHVITPNPTEAAILLNRNPHEYNIQKDGSIVLSEAESLAFDLSLAFPGTLPVVKSTTYGEDIGVVARFTPANTVDTKESRTEYYFAQRIKSGQISGAGDTFISWLVGNWLTLENPSKLSKINKGLLLQDTVDRISSAIVYARRDDLKRMPFSRLFSMHSSNS